MLILMPRTCDACNRGMAEGFLIDDGSEYYCSKKCLHSVYTPEEYEEMYNDGEGSSYWTEWAMDEADPDDEPNEISAYAYGKRAFQTRARRIPGGDWTFWHSLQRSPIPRNLQPLEQWLEGYDDAKNEAKNAASVYA